MKPFPTPVVRGCFLEDLGRSGGQEWRAGGILSLERMSSVAEAEWRGCDHAECIDLCGSWLGLSPPL